MEITRDEFEKHKHDGSSSVKIPIRNIIPVLSMTTTEINAYLLEPAQNGDMFLLHDTTLNEYFLYSFINNVWTLTQGAKGDKGDTGSQGDKGDKGDKGDTGAMGTFNYFGNGSDGDVVISTNTSLSRDMYYHNLTINNGIVLNPNGYRIFVSGTTTFIGTGLIARNGNNANLINGGIALADGTIKGGMAGSNGGSGGEYSDGGSPGYSGDNGVNSQSIENVGGVSGGKGGDTFYSGSGNTGGNPGIGGISTSENSLFEDRELISLTTLTLNTENQSYISRVTFIKGSVSGDILSMTASSGGGGGGATVFNGSVAGNGGGGGGNGGIVYFASFNIITVDGNDFIQVKGGNGANGGNALNDCPLPNGGGGGGGGGGNGGLAIVIYKTLTGTGTINVSKGLKGIGGMAASLNTATDKNGHDGIDGNDGKYIKLKILDNN